MESRKQFALQVAIYFAIVLLFFVLPPVGAITPAGMKLLGVFIAFIYGLTVTSDNWPALITLILLPFTGLLNFAGVLSLSFGNDTFIFVLLSLVLVAYMEVSGAADFIAAWLLKRKFLIGHPWRLIFMLMFICWLLSSFVNAIAGMMLTWAFIYQIFAKFNYKPFEKLPSVIMLGTCVVGGLGLSTLPWGNNSIVILSAFTNMTGLEVDYFLYMGFSIPYSVVTILAYLLMCKFIFRVDVSALKDFDSSMLSEESQTLNAEKLFAMIAMVALVVSILVPNCLPADSGIVALSKKIGLSGKLFAIFAVLQLIRIDGKAACDFAKVAKKGINWGLIIIVADILAFSSLIGNEQAGIGTFMAEILAPVFIGKPAFVFIVLATVVTIACTNFMVNKIIATLMVTMTMPIILALGIDPVQMTCIYTVACTIAFLLPSASQSAFVLFSNTEWVRAGDVFKYGVPTIIMMTILILVWSTLYFSVF